MALFETQVRFKTYELLCDMLELSNFMFNRHEEIIKHGNIYEYIPKFAFGRQTGKTDAVIRYIRERKEKNIIVFTHNTSMLQYYMRKLDGCANGNTYLSSASSNHNKYKGIDLSGYTIIFDELATNQVQDIITELRPQLKDISSMKMVAIIY